MTMQADFEQDKLLEQKTSESPNTPEHLDSERVALLRDYVGRLVDGADLEAVRADFVENFQSVDAAEIAKAEQELIKGGTPVAEVQRLCDVHSALFHGATSTEQLAKAEAAVHASVNQIKKADQQLQAVQDIPGHPVQVFRAENRKISQLIQEAQAAIDKKADLDQLLAEVAKLRVLAIHYARKGDLIYPLLNRKYGFSGPASVMWGVDDEIRDDLKLLARVGERVRNFPDRLRAILERAQEMVFKEDNILFPLCLREFSEEDWLRIYYEMPAYESLLPEGYPRWELAEERREDLKTVGGQTVASRRAALEGAPESASAAASSSDQMITLGSGQMTPEQILGVLNTIPLELTFVDADNINRFFSAGEKLFKRPDMAIGRDVFSCHPPKLEPMVRGIIESFRSGARDHVDVWMEKQGQPVMVRYMAVRNSEGQYLGTLETVQPMGFAQEHFKA